MATKVYPTNLQFLKRSYGSRTEGEIFAMRLVTGPYLFGRVIVTNSPSGAAPMPGSNLIYVYRERSETPVCDHRGLTPDRLLLAPIWTNRQSWTRGYFIKVGQAPLEPWMLLDHHCFSAPISTAARESCFSDYGASG